MLKKVFLLFLTLAFITVVLSVVSVATKDDLLFAVEHHDGIRVAEVNVGDVFEVRGKEITPRRICAVDFSKSKFELKSFEISYIVENRFGRTMDFVIDTFSEIIPIRVDEQNQLPFGTVQFDLVKEVIDSYGSNNSIYLDTCIDKMVRSYDSGSYLCEAIWVHKIVNGDGSKIPWSMQLDCTKSACSTTSSECIRRFINYRDINSISVLAILRRSIGLIDVRSAVDNAPKDMLH